VQWSETLVTSVTWNTLPPAPAPAVADEVPVPMLEEALPLVPLLVPVVALVPVVVFDCDPV
jgi:hypothetical protein